MMVRRRVPPSNDSPWVRRTMTPLLDGILPAAVTPVDDAGRFAPAVMEQLLTRLYAAGVHGVYLCGSTGEGMLHSREQRQAVVETAIACTPKDRHVIVHVGAASMDDALALSAHAAKAGAHAISSLPPSSGQFSFADLLRYYEALARSSELPLVVYYFPDVAPAIATGEQLEALCALPNVAGVKFTDFDLYRMASLRRARSEYLQRPRRGAGGRPADGGRRGIGTFYNLLPGCSSKSTRRHRGDGRMHVTRRRESIRSSGSR